MKIFFNPQLNNKINGRCEIAMQKDIVFKGNCVKNSSKFITALQRDTAYFSSKTLSLADDTKLNAKLKKIAPSIAEIVEKSKENYINGGYTADFFDLKTPQGVSIGYVLGIPKTAVEKMQKGTYIYSSKFVKAKDEYPDFNVGQCVAKCGDLRIHKKIDGVVCGVTYDTNGKTPEERWEYESNCIFEPKHYSQYLNHMERLEKLSENQNAFDEFAEEIMRLSDKYMFDPFPNNTLIDIEGEKINIIDPTTQENAQNFQCHGNHLAGMLGNLFDPKYVSRQSEQARSGQIDEIPTDSDPKFVNIRRALLKNVLLAAKKANMSFAVNPYREGSGNHKYYNLDYLFKISGLGQDDLKIILDFSESDYKTFEKVVNDVI